MTARLVPAAYRSRSLIHLALVALGIVRTLQAQAPTSLEVRVRDVVSGAPVFGANVRLRHQGLARTSDSAGVARFAGLSGEIDTVIVRAVGFAPRGSVVELASGESSRIDIALRHTTAELDSVVITGARGEPWLRIPGWDTRRAAGGGHVITSADIQRMQPTTTADAMRMAPGVRVERVAGRDRIRLLRSATSCPPQVYVDGIRVTTEIDLTGPAIASRSRADPAALARVSEFDLASGSIIDQINPRDVEAIEIFNGPSETPAEYNATGNNCGVVLVWTRRPK